ncbi:MAG: tetratricopeptide repeat protein [Ignavibacteria bacterium]|jgi:tetratricopeptide (TPR) repeat protein|nr:tetratricopeptide repeat protein [Ignavibacteria bacterium]MDH7527191.1 tetratricopeptide repeat protein [Ignavibacteria bacterium]NPV10663.1 tetratricopeptide repeat protein [Ignavibacteria bacterium]
MKKIIYYLGIFTIVISTIILTNVVFSQQKDEKISAFNTSINEAFKGNYQKATDALLNVYKNNENDYLLNLRLGYLYYLQKKYDQSINYYQKAIRLTQEKSIEPYLGLTLPLSGQEKWNEIEKIYQKVLTLDPNNYTANLRLGQLYFNRREYSKAENFLKKVYDLYPSDYEANLYLGWTYFYLNKKSEAKSHFINTLMISENDKSALEGLKLVK